MQRAGIPLHSAPLSEDLKRLALAIRRTGATRCLFLGDLVHAPTGMTARVRETIAAWRAELADVQFQLLRGNHDRRIDLPDDWAIEEFADGTIEGPFRFTHACDLARPNLTAPYTWSGHIHPAVRLRYGADQIRVPCFIIKARDILLPAFGSLTGTTDVDLGRGDRVYAVADTSVHLVPLRGLVTG